MNLSMLGLLLGCLAVVIAMGGFVTDIVMGFQMSEKTSRRIRILAVAVWTTGCILFGLGYFI